MTELSIIIPTLNRLDNLVPCIESIKLRTSVDFEIIVYANACDRDTADYLDSADVRSIRDPENKFFTEAANRAIETATGRYVFLLNDDTVLLRDDWFAFYQRHLEIDPRIAVVGPYWKNIDELPYGWIEPYATLYRRDVLVSSGGLPYFDFSFVLWWSDIYHAYRLMRDGHYLLPLSRSVVDAFVHHRRVGESGDTVRRLKPTLPDECFHFHGKELMYRRLEIGDERDLAGYYDGAVWGPERTLGFNLDSADDSTAPAGDLSPHRIAS